MRIAYIADSIIPSQSANSVHVMKMCSSLIDIKYELNLYLPDIKSKYPDYDEFKFYNVRNRFNIKKILYPNVKGNMFFFGLASIFSLRKNKPDVIISRNLASAFFGTMFGYNVIFESHAPINLGTNFPQIFSFIFQSMIKRKNFIKLVLITNQLKEYYLQNFTLKNSLIEVLPDASDPIPEFVSRPPKDFCKRNKNIQVGYIGSLYEGKGLKVLQNIYKHLPEVDFHIVGGNEEDVTFWKKLINADNVKFYGFKPQSEIKYYIKELDVCLLPNDPDVFVYDQKRNHRVNIGEFTSPLKLFEYMAHGKIILASNLPVLKEILNSRNSILIDHDDYEKWILIIKEISNNINKYKILGDEARACFLKNYTWYNRAKRFKYIIN